MASERVRFAEAPTVVLGKVRPTGVTCRCDWLPVPERFAMSGNDVREVAMLTAPVRMPVCDGVKVTCRVQLAEGWSCAPGTGQLPATV